MHQEYIAHCVCEHCYRPFTVQSNQLRHRTPRFCSMSCYHADRSTPTGEKFWAKVRLSPDGCWLWLGRPDRAGYGRFFGGYAHRFAFELAFGPIPEGMEVCHRCDNPPCVRPGHFFLGTPKQNVRDCIDKGRFRKPPLTVAVTPETRVRGERVGVSKLTADGVALMRQLYAAGDATQAELARRFGVTDAAVSNVLSRRTWKHVA